MQTRHFIYIFLVLLLAACEDKKEEATPTPAPVVPQESPKPKITIATPSLNQHYNQGDDIKVSATISDDKQLKVVSSEIKDLMNGSTTIYDSGDINTQTASYSLNFSYKVSKSTMANYLLVIKAWDSDGNFTESSEQLWIN